MITRKVTWLKSQYKLFCLIPKLLSFHNHTMLSVKKGCQILTEIMKESIGPIMFIPVVLLPVVALGFEHIISFLHESAYEW